jgi:hypothetical protein
MRRIAGAVAGGSSKRGGARPPEAGDRHAACSIRSGRAASTAAARSGAASSSTVSGEANPAHSRAAPETAHQGSLARALDHDGRRGPGAAGHLGDHCLRCARCGELVGQLGLERLDQEKRDQCGDEVLHGDVPSGRHTMSGLVRHRESAGNARQRGPDHRSGKRWGQAFALSSSGRGAVRPLVPLRRRIPALPVRRLRELPPHQPPHGSVLHDLRPVHRRCRSLPPAAQPLQLPFSPRGRVLVLTVGRCADHYLARSARHSGCRRHGFPTTNG